MGHGSGAMESLALTAGARFAPEPGFWRGRRVLVTGHTGFKGGWLTLWLAELGAVVRGFALAPATTPNLFEAAGIGRFCDGVLGDLRDAERVARVVADADPDIVFHLAAQPLVRRSYRAPVETFAVNVLGTIHLLEAVRAAQARAKRPRAIVVAATDKVYDDVAARRAFVEGDALGGHDPYAASKAAAEIAVQSWRRSFLAEAGIAVASARSGNVFGGGDWNEDRIVADAARAFAGGRVLAVRNPASVRPWQPVGEALAGYLALARALIEEGAAFATAWNFGPAPSQAATVGELVERFAASWGSGARWSEAAEPGAPHESPWLLLDSSAARERLGWRSGGEFARALGATAEWYARHAAGADADELVARIAAECRVAADAR